MVKVEVKFYERMSIVDKSGNRSCTKLQFTGGYTEDEVITTMSELTIEDYNMVKRGRTYHCYYDYKWRENNGN